MPVMKQRLDELLVQRRLAADLRTARAMIVAGEVVAGDQRADKPGTLFPDDICLRVKEKCPYVSRGGLKLVRGLEHFRLDPSGMCCIDVGASSGGFTDCLLQHGAARVFAVDVAYGQLDWKIRQDSRVVVKERFNARHIKPTDLDRAVDLAVMDASFISITRILPVLPPLFSNLVRILTLVKPQFELPRELVGKGGVVRDPELHRQAVESVSRFAEELGLYSQGVVTSPIRGPKGNTEFLLFLISEPDL